LFVLEMGTDVSDRVELVEWQIVERRMVERLGEWYKI